VLELVLLACLLAVAAGVIAADRSVRAVAERRASALLDDQLGPAASVRFHAAPFLTQALRGRYRDVRVSGGGLPIGDLRASALEARLTNVYVPARALLGGRLTELPCEHVSGRILLPYRELAAVMPVPGLALGYADRLVVTASLPVPGISALARVSGRAYLHVDNGNVWLRVSHLSVAGIGATSLVLRQLMPQLDVAVPIAALPWGLQLQDLTPTPDGLVAEAAADAVVIRLVGDLVM
jgi:hypothetical protein